MKKFVSFMLVALLPMLAGIAANAQELTLSDVQNSGCMRSTRSRVSENETMRKIVLTKEETILTVQLQGYVSNCATEGFDVTPSMSGGSDGELVSVSVGVEPIESDVSSMCECPFNISFTLHGLETNSFYFSCWWYEGQVNLTEGEPLTLESITEPVQIDEWYCIIDKVNHTAIVCGVDVGISELLIPQVLLYEWQEYYVTGIDGAFYNYDVLTSVTLPPDLTHISDFAFAYCDNLTDVYCYAENAPTTESNVFNGTPIASATLHVPAGSIEKYKAASPWNKFGNIVGEGNVTIDGLKYYLDSSTYTALLGVGNTWVGELDIPSEVSFYGQTYVVTSMARNAFLECSELTKVRIPKNLEFIIHGYYTTNPYEEVPTGLLSSDHMNPFQGCIALESIDVDEENPSLKSVDGVFYSQDGKGYYYYQTNNYYGTGLYCYPAGAQRRSYTIPDGVEWIGSEAFEGNQYISSLTMPSSLKQICNNVFAGCNNLTNIFCYAENVPIAFGYAFYDFPIASATLHVPAGSIEAYKATAPWKDFGTIVGIPEEYYPEGTKWIEIRLDTLKYNSWYSKVGDDWVPNFETIEYRVQGECTAWDVTFNKVYTNGPEWTDSLTLLISNEDFWENRNRIMVTIPNLYDESFIMFPAEIYQFDWSVGKGLYYCDIEESNSTGEYPYYFFFGVIDEIKEGDFGGVRPLKYVDLDGKAPDNTYEDWDWGYTDGRGGRIIQGIGITEWNDGECLFGPPDPYFAKTWSSGDRHYRSMLVHFERNDEVLYDVWPEKETIMGDPVTYTAGQMATIILPTPPDASKGKYYRLDRYEDGQIVFEQELEPQAHVPYIIVPNEDFSIDLSTLDLAGCYRDTVSVDDVSFIGSYVSETFDYPDGFYIDFIDTTPDCRFDESCVIGALRAYLLVRWDDPYNQGGTRVPPLNKMGIVLRDYETGITSPIGETGKGAAIYNLAGQQIAKSQKGINIIRMSDGTTRKILIK